MESGAGGYGTVSLACLLAFQVLPLAAGPVRLLTFILRHESLQRGTGHRGLTETNQNKKDQSEFYFFLLRNDSVTTADPARMLRS